MQFHLFYENIQLSKRKDKQISTVTHMARGICAHVKLLRGICRQPEGRQIANGWNKPGFILKH
jgi:hypothetical protein